MSNVTLGSIVGPDAQRDAIHVAIAPTAAAEELSPGQHVGLDSNGSAVASGGTTIGIVDPFLKHKVGKGEWFYICLYPQTVTGMRHHWSHPAFPDEPSEPSRSKPASESYLRAFAEDADMTYEDLLTYLWDYMENHSTYVEIGSGFARDAYLSRDPHEFWLHAEVVTGLACPDRDPADAFPFSCKC